MKVISLSALHTGRLYTPVRPGNIPGTHFCSRLLSPGPWCGRKCYVNEKS